MTVSITHSKVSGRAAGTSPTRIYGTHWDAEHTVTGLENVDNTSDLDKPISTATQTALNALSNGSAPASGRLTLVTGVPYMTSTQSAKTSIFFTPSDGCNRVPIYDGSHVVPTIFTELTGSTTDTAKNKAAVGANEIHDWFVWNDSGTLRLCHGDAWASASARGSAIQLVQGTWINSADLSPGVGALRGTYVGTTLSDGSSKLNWVLGASAAGGTAAKLHVWNLFNRRTVVTAVTEETSHTYSSSTIRQFNNSAGNQIGFVLGLQEDGVQFAYNTEITLAAASAASAIVGPGFDSTSAFGTTRTRRSNPTTTAYSSGAAAFGVWAAGQGSHVLSLNEQGDGTNANEFNNTVNATLMATLRM